jgi:hypothetical protein
MEAGIMGWFSSKTIIQKRRRRPSKKTPYIRKRPLFENLEERCCLSYDLQVVAHTDGANPGGFFFTGFSEAPAINDTGVVSFVGQQPAGGEGLFKASGNPLTLQRLEGSTPNRSIGVAASVDDEGELAATIRINADLFNPVSFRVNKYPSDVTIATAGRNGDQFPDGTVIQDYVGVGFVGSGDRIKRSVVYSVTEVLNNVPTGRVNIWENINGTSRQVTSSLIRTIIPAVADGGAFVVQTETPSNEPIILYKPQFDANGVFNGTNETFIAGRSRFSDLGAAPGITDDGRIVAFYGVLTDAGAALINAAQPGLQPLNPGAGLFVSVELGSIRVFQRVAGISGNGLLEPGESHNDANGNSNVEVGEDVGGYSGLAADSPLNIDVRSGVAQIAFVATSTDGFKGINVHEFRVATNGEVNRAGVTSERVVQVGETIPGFDALVDDLRIYRGLNRQGVVAFLAELADGNSALIKAVPDASAVLNVVTHGFGNDFFNDFLAPWYELAENLDNLPAVGTPLAGNVSTYVANWDSSTGWVRGALTFLAGVVLDKSSHPLAKLAAAAMFAKAALDVSAAGHIAEVTATTIVADIRGSGLLVQDPELTHSGDQRIHLIGHSRGAAVNARVASLLVNKGYLIDQYTALDGYSVDWPNGTDLLGDLDIVGEIAPLGDLVNRKVNYRVEAGLDELFIGFIPDIMRDEAAKILGRAVGPMTNTILQLLQLELRGWRAPNRAGFDNYLLEGLISVGKRSAHFSRQGFLTNEQFVGAVELYSASAHTQPLRTRYILDNYLGQFANLPFERPPLAAPASGTGIGSSESDAGSTVGTSASVGSAGSDFIDGSFDEVAALVALFNSTAFPLTGDEAIDAWIEVSKRPSELIGTVWDAIGDFEIQAPNGDASIVLRESSNGTTDLGQLIHISPDCDTLQFDLELDFCNLGFQYRLAMNLKRLRPDVV